MPTREDIRQFPLRLPREDYETLRNLAFFSGRSMNSIVTAVLSDFLATAGRGQLLDAMIERGRAEYRPLLDKLADA